MFLKLRSFFFSFTDMAGAGLLSLTALTALVAHSQCLASGVHGAGHAGRTALLRLGALRHPFPLRLRGGVGERRNAGAEEWSSDVGDTRLVPEAMLAPESSSAIQDVNGG